MHTDTKKVQRNTDGAQKPSKSPTCLGAASNGVLTAKAEGSIPTWKNKHAACEHTMCTALSAFINPRHAYTSWPAESYKPTTMQSAHSEQSTAFTLHPRKATSLNTIMTHSVATCRGVPSLGWHYAALTSPASIDAISCCGCSVSVAIRPYLATSRSTICGVQKAGSCGPSLRCESSRAYRARRGSKAVAWELSLS